MGKSCTDMTRTACFESDAVILLSAPGMTAAASLGAAGCAAGDSADAAGVNVKGDKGASDLSA